ncbi:MAG: hypothetical protein K2K16_00495 [Ruminococcus sp.]|nr:hypothetical protein [Ruminococcus sp.]
MESMKEALQIVFEVLKGFLAMILSLITENISGEVLVALIIIAGTVAIIYIIAKLSSKIPKRRKYRKY